MKYILEFETLEELLIAQAKVNATKITETREYKEEVDQFIKDLDLDPTPETIWGRHEYIIKKFLQDILKQEADIRKSMFL